MDDVRHPTLDPHLFGGHLDLLVVPVHGLEPDPVTIPVELLYRHLLPTVQQCHDHFTLGWILILLNHQEIAVLYPRPGHRVAPHPERVPPPARTREEQVPG